MLAMHHNAGFYCAPVTKALLGGQLLSSIAFNLPLHSYRYWFSYTYPTIFEKYDILRFLVCRLVFLDPKDLVCASLLLYHFRIFERRYGSRKFAGCLLTSWLLSMVLELGAVYACHHADINLDPMPSGPYGAVFSLFVPYFCDIPRVAVSHVMHIPVTGKSINYIIGLQMASGCAESMLLALTGLGAGILYKNNFLKIRSLIQVPRFMESLCSMTIGWLVDTPPPSEPEIPMGATLEIQRQQQIDRMEQQMVWAQFQQARQPRNFRGFGIFRNQVPEPQIAQNGNIPAPAAPSEDQVQQLVEMGFTRDSVLQALRVTNNDIQLATNILLQES